MIVGAGIGGLAAAIDLARAGLRVTVLERASAAGGKMRQVPAAGQAIDAGPTVFTMRHVFEALFADAGACLSDHVTLQRAETLARHAWPDGSRLDLFADIDRSADAIGQFAGAAEARGYRQFCARAEQIYRTLDHAFMRAARPSSPLGLVGRAPTADLLRISPFATLWSALGEHFRDKRLRQLFGRYSTYCGGSPFLAPATLMLIAHAERDGVWLVQGGMIRLAQALAALAERLGVTVQTGAEVAEVTGAAHATGVRLACGTHIDASVVVLNADTAAATAGLFGRDAARAVPDTGLPRSLSALTWAMVARTDGFPLLRHTVFFSDAYAAEFEAIFRDGRLPGTPTVYVCAQDRDDTGAGAQAGNDAAERLLCLVNAPALGDRATDPKEIEACTTRTFQHLARCGLRITDTQTVLTGPAEFHRLFPATGGALYGPAMHGTMAPFRRPAARSRMPGLYLCGGSTHPGAGGADGGTIGTAGGGERAAGPRFDQDVAQRGYEWWYVDALSDDGAHGITIIAFLGSVFSPYYAWARRGGGGDPMNHCSVHVSLHGPRGNRWAFTERGRKAVEREAHWLRIGPSALTWTGTSLRIDIDEWTAYAPTRIRGSVTVHPAALTQHVVQLDAAGRHRWRPLAPRSRVVVSLLHPEARWTGDGYFDTNAGDAPLEHDFSHWHWSCARLRQGSAILYDVTRRDGTRLPVSLGIDLAGTVTEHPAPPVVALAPTRWRVPRETRTDGAARVTRTLLDSPFYARSVLATQMLGEPAVAVHESLSMDRFSAGWVQAMLPFRVPRAL